MNKQNTKYALLFIIPYAIGVVLIFGTMFALKSSDGFVVTLAAGFPTSLWLLYGPTVAKFISGPDFVFEILTVVINAGLLFVVGFYAKKHSKRLYYTLLVLEIIGVIILCVTAIQELQSACPGLCLIPN